MNAYFVQWQKLLRLAWPIFAAQLAMTAMNFVDTIMAGRYSEVDLAGIAIGGSIWMPTSLATQAVLFSITAIAAPYWGAKNFSGAGAALRQGLWLALFAGLIGAAVSQAITLNIGIFELADDVQAITTEYLFYLAFAYPAVALYQALRSFIEATGRTQPIMLVNLFGLLANIPLNYLFIYGGLGIEPMGGAGCGVATSLVFYIMLLGLLLYVLCSDLAPIAFEKRWQWPQLTAQLQLLRVGLPISVTIFAEVSIFAIIALLVAPLGTTEVAGHQIALSFSAQSFMLPLSLSLALSIHIGHLLGQEKFTEIRTATHAGLALSLLLACGSFLIIFFLRENIAGLYTSEPALIAIASQILMIASFYQWPDALQVCAIGILRAYKVTSRPLLIVLAAYWLVALPLGYSLGLTDLWQAYFPALGAAGLWIGLIAGLSFAAVFLLALLHHRGKQLPH